MKQLAVIVSFSLLVACSPGGTDDKKAELDSYRQKVEEYNKKIAELEAERALKSRLIILIMVASLKL